MRLYLDANTIIYSIEGVPALRTPTLEWMGRAVAGGRGEIVTSRFSLVETRSKPLRDGNKGLLDLYDNFFRRATVIEITALVVDRATELRARFGVRSADAIHLATALLGQVDTFLTSDRNLKRVSDLNVVVLE